MGPIWVLLAPDGPHVWPMNFAFRGPHERNVEDLSLDDPQIWSMVVRNSFDVAVIMPSTPSHYIDNRSRYGNFQYKDKTVVRPCYFYNKNDPLVSIPQSVHKLIIKILYYTYYFYFRNNDQIWSSFFPWHDNSTVVTCTNLWAGCVIIIITNRKEWCFKDELTHRSWRGSPWPSFITAI